MYEHSQFPNSNIAPTDSAHNAEELPEVPKQGQISPDDYVGTVLSDQWARCPWGGKKRLGAHGWNKCGFSMFQGVYFIFFQISPFLSGWQE